MTEVAQRESLLATPLDTHVVGSRVLVFEEVRSTSDHALRLGGDGTVIVADAQTAGRGRHGRSWRSAPGLGLWFSVAFENPVPGLAFGAPLAVRDGLSRYGTPTVKWPNDLLFDGRKVSGVLLESRLETTVLGVGINVNHEPEDFPEEIRGQATSVRAECGQVCRRDELLRAVLTELDRKVMVLRSGGVEPVWREWSAACGMTGRRVRYDGLDGVVTDIDVNGALVVSTDAGMRRVLFGESVELLGA
jgi:BirA family transcriptional regulator, biotin operon repressor / biotin---[acetyl-CoA-carboxylase] ligase